MSKYKSTMCDICGQDTAVVDGKTSYGPWAYMCEACFAELGIQVEGLYSWLPGYNMYDSSCGHGLRDRAATSLM
jgi:hypothetical protein